MRKITRISLALGTSAALLSLSALPASAAEGDIIPPAELGATIEVLGGGMSISVATPDAQTDTDFDMGAPSRSARTAIITVPKLTVEDLRAVDATWSVTVSLTDFSQEGSEQAIDAEGATYKIADTVEPVGDITIEDPATGAGVKLVKAPGEVKATGSIMSAAVVGTNTASWVSAVEVPVPANVLQGEYKAVLTHSLLG